MKLRNYLESVDSNIRLHGIGGELKELHDKSDKKMIELIKGDSHISTYYNWISGKTPIPLMAILQLISLDKDIVDKAFEKATFFSIGGKRCRLPREINTELSYLIGVMHGDGSIHKNGKYLTVTGESMEYFRDILNPLFEHLFGVSGGISSMKRKNIYYRLTVGSKVVHSFFSLFCPVGKKKGKLRIPEIIKNDNSLLSHYLSGLFDTDGCLTHVEKGRKQIYFTFVQSDKEFVFEVYRALISLGIKPNEPGKFLSPSRPGKRERNLVEWRIYIGSKFLLKEFLKKISFSHPLKRLRANLIIKIWAGGDSRKRPLMQLRKRSIPFELPTSANLNPLS